MPKSPNQTNPACSSLNKPPLSSHNPQPVPTSVTHSLPDNFAAILSETTRSSQDVQCLRAEISHLYLQVTRLESLVSSLGTAALVMPEDLGDFSQASPRIQGLVTRIHQTHNLSTAVQALRTATPSEAPRFNQPSGARY